MSARCNGSIAASASRRRTARYQDSRGRRDCRVRRARRCEVFRRRHRTGVERLDTRRDPDVRRQRAVARRSPREISQRRRGNDSIRAARTQAGGSPAGSLDPRRGRHAALVPAADHAVLPTLPAQDAPRVCACLSDPPASDCLLRRHQRSRAPAGGPRLPDPFAL